MKKKKIEGLRRRILWAALAGAFAVFLFAVFGDNGLLTVWRLKKELKGIEGYNRTLQAENRELEENINLLKTDRRYLGFIARQELGMIGKNEIVYKMDDAKK